MTWSSVHAGGWAHIPSSQLSRCVAAGALGFTPRMGIWAQECMSNRSVALTSYRLSSREHRVSLPLCSTRQAPAYSHVSLSMQSHQPPGFTYPSLGYTAPPCESQWT